MSQFVHEGLADLTADFCLARTDGFDVLLVKHDVGWTCRYVNPMVVPRSPWQRSNNRPILKAGVLYFALPDEGDEEKDERNGTEG